MNDNPDFAHRPLTGLLLAQFLGAFNDNAFKIMVALLAVGAVQATGEAAAQTAATTAFVVFTLPLLLGSVPAMLLGDRVGKRDLIVWTKLLEVALMGAGTWVLAVQPVGWAPLAVLAGMGLQSALFAPGKYGILPEIVPHDRLALANGRLEAASFLAIILGTAAGGVLLDVVGLDLWLGGALLLLFSVIGLFGALAVPQSRPAAQQHESFAATATGAWRALRGDRALWLATLGTAAFWGLASLLGQDVLIYGKEVLGFPDRYAGIPYALFAVGVGIGALLAGRWSRGQVEVGLIPLGALGLLFGTAMLGATVPGTAGTFAWMFVLGASSGFVVVPLNSLVQWRAPAARRGAIIALVNGLAFAGILLGNLACLWLARSGCDCAAILLVAAGLTVVATAWAIWLLPIALLRFCLLLVTRTLYRLRVVGVRNVPATGGALLLPNHVSFADGFLLLAALDRDVRFVVDQAWYDRPLLRPVLRACGAIPVAANQGPRELLAALRRAAKALDDGEVVCLFAEGEISRNGALLPFRRGMQRIVDGRLVPVVPVHLDRVYGQIGSRRRGRLQWWPRRVPAPVTISFGTALPSTIEPEQVRARIAELGEMAARMHAESLPPLHAPFVRVVRRAPFRACLVDAGGTARNRLTTLAGSVALARRWRQRLGDQQRVGMLLPSSIGGVLTALATSLAGRSAVPLNYTAGALAIHSAIRQAELRTIVTSRAFVQRLGIVLPEGTEAIWLEDEQQLLSLPQRAAAVLASLLLPRRWLERWCGARRSVVRDDEAAVLFSSGSTGEPKGIVLSHGNVHANCDAVAQVLPLDRRDGVLAVLPLFHSFGNLVVWYALGQGARLLCHHDPRDAATIGDLAATQRATLLLATPTFLQLYLRRCEPGQFGSLRVVLTGAERLPEELADAFAARFGIRPIAGYGCTECAPVVATSCSDFRTGGYFQAGSRRGSVGRPLPGVAVTIVDPTTMQPLPIGSDGLVLVRGPNVMRGYLGRPDLTAAAMHDGSYVTGDLGHVDADGFLFLVGRESRFSKIGGEMVPHGTVEDHLQACSGEADRVVVVCGAPDAQKGERLVVLTTLRDGRIDAMLARMQGRGLPPLFVPRRANVVTVDSLPMLGSGKVDLARATELCRAAVASS